MGAPAPAHVPWHQLCNPVSILAALLVAVVHGTYGFQGIARPALHLAVSWVVADVALRASVVASLLLHELSHTAAAALLLCVQGVAAGRPAQALKRAAGVFHAANLLGHVPPSEWLRALLPGVLRASGGDMPRPYVVASDHDGCCPGKAHGGGGSHAFDVFVRRAGAAGSAAAALAATGAFLAAPAAGGAAGALMLAAVVAGTWVVLAGATCTDVLERPRQRPGVFCCGNFGVLLALLTEGQANMADFAPWIMQRMCEVTQVRGGQAAGIASIVLRGPAKKEANKEGWTGGGVHAVDGVDYGSSMFNSHDPHRNSFDIIIEGEVPPRPKVSFGGRSSHGSEGSSVHEAKLDAMQQALVVEDAPTEGDVTSKRFRLVSGKRDNMPKTLREGYMAQGPAASDYDGDTISAAFIGHTRFATTSLPELNETHPHEWTPFDVAEVWVWHPSAREFKKESKCVGIHLSHNGDFDLLKFFGRDLTVGQVGLWLQRVLRVPNTTKGDSAKIAGTLELLRCQGQFDKAVRLAYQMTVATSVTEACGGQGLSPGAPNTAPTIKWQKLWASVLDATFQEHMHLLVEDGGNGTWRPLLMLDFLAKVLDRLGGMDTEVLREMGALNAQQALEHLLSNYIPVVEKEKNKRRSSGGASMKNEDFANMTIAPSQFKGMDMSDIFSGNGSEGPAPPPAPAPAPPPAPPAGAGDGPSSFPLHATEVAFGGGEGAGVESMSHKKKNSFFARALTRMPTVARKDRLVDAGATATHIRHAAAKGAHGLDYEELNVDEDEQAIDEMLKKDEEAAAKQAEEAPKKKISKYELARTFNKKNKGSNEVTPRMIARVDSSRAPMAGMHTKKGGRAHAASPDDTFKCPQMSRRLLVRFLKKSILYFIHNDMYESVKLFLGRATGSFGLTAVSTLEPGSVIVAAWGQQMSIALDKEKRMALYGSETAAMKVAVKERKGAASRETPASRRSRFMSHRVDLDETHGEVVRLALGERALQDTGSAYAPNSVYWQGGLAIRSFRFRIARELTPREFYERLVEILDNPLVQPLPEPSAEEKEDLVGADIRAIPEVLDSIRDSWQAPKSLNRETALHFSHMVYEKCEVNASRRVTGAHQARGLDLLIVGVESSLWIAEQFACDLKRVFPKLLTDTVSANKVLQLLGSQMPDEIPNTGSGFHRGSVDLENAIVLVVSQSGQTFPALHASRLLHTVVGNRLFVLTGEFDTKLGLVVGQDYARPKKFCRRIFSNLSGWRPAEPTTVAAAAAHATLSELLMYMLHLYTLELGEDCRRVFGMHIPAKDVANLAEMRDGCVDKHTPAICGLPPVGGGKHAVKVEPVHLNLVEQGERWAAHIMEGWRALVMAAIYVFITVTFQVSPFGLIAYWIGANGYFWEEGEPWKLVAGFLLRLCDSAVYVWFGYAFTLLMRHTRGEDILARTGKRTIVIADIPYVHQLLESYVSKLFAMSWGHVGVDVHGANPVDHFVHRFTHRVSRGVLIAMGRPDGRVCSLAKSDQSVLLAAMQAAAIQNLKTGPEILTVGHNTYPGVPDAVRVHVVIPSSRRRFLCEYMLSKMVATNTNDPQAVLAELGGDIVMPREEMLLTRQGATECDRCHKLLEDVHNAVECLQCKQITCGSCDRLVHMSFGFAKRTSNLAHQRIPAGAAALMRLRARRARLAVFTRVFAKQREEGSRKSVERRVSMNRSTVMQTSQGAAEKSIGSDLQLLAKLGGDRFRVAMFGSRGKNIVLAAPAEALKMQDAPIGMHHCRHFNAKQSHRVAKARWRRAYVAIAAQLSPWRELGLRMQAAGLLNVPELQRSVNLFTAGAESNAKGMLAIEKTLEALYESRFGSFERYISFLVLFHAMAKKVSRGMWILPSFDISRSQSILRVASTAAPVSGAEVSEVLAAAAKSGHQEWFGAKRGMHFTHMTGREKQRTISF